MNKIALIIGLSIIISCNQNTDLQKIEVENWKLGWRIIASSTDENYKLADSQFDSLWNKTKSIDQQYLTAGLEAKKKLGKDNEITEILSSQSIHILNEICKESFLSKFEKCKNYSVEKVENEELQIELIKMYINDQYIRSNLLTEILNKYNLTKKEVVVDLFGMNTDERNTERLKKIIEQYGFPTKKMVGKDAMDGVFLIIQHSNNSEWQKAQLLNIKRAIDKGDMDFKDYCYLYDRIKIKQGEKQLYGTQFKKVDKKTKTVELAPTEDIENLNQRRMEARMMPIEMYKEIIIKDLQLH